MIFLLFALFLINNSAESQIQKPNTPQFEQIKPINHQNSPVNRQPYTVNTNQKNVDNEVPKSTVINPNSVFKQLSQNNHALNSQSFIPPKQITSIQYIHDLVNDQNNTTYETNSTFPLLIKNSWRFNDAYTQIASMLSGKTSLDLQKAVFLTENAYLDGILNKIDFGTAITRSADFIRKKIIQDGLNPNDDLTVNFYIHQFINDTLMLVENGKQIISKPKIYDFSDPFGIEDPTKMFVSKLLQKESGQCKSLPLLFLLLVEELDGNAYLSFSPSHSFIKCKGRNGELFNIELTNGMLTNDAWLVGSGQIKSEAVRCGIFLDTLNRKQVISNCLVDLAMYYSWRYGKPNSQMGQDDFILKCVDLALSYHSSNINAILVKSDNYTVRLNYLASQKGYTTEEQIINDSTTNEIFNKRNILYALVDGLGYEYFGEADYLKWIKESESGSNEKNNFEPINKFKNSK